MTQVYLLFQKILVLKESIEVYLIGDSTITVNIEKVFWTKEKGL